MEVSGNIGDVEMNSSKTNFSIAGSVVPLQLAFCGREVGCCTRADSLGICCQRFFVSKLHADYVEFWM